MSVKERKERERAERHRLIVDSARELAEAEGWDAVTTRRLAERVEYSQPVLYSHFNGKDAIIAAVAIEGFADIAAELRRARRSRRAPEVALRALADSYLGFARDRPALYEAMFVRPLDIPFGAADSPAALKEAFGEFVAALEPLAGDRDLETLAEVFWSALHGLATLTRGDRLRTSQQKARLDLLVDQFVQTGP
ncbi:TetR/AcrR family transcriptional regulator [Saccharopolyspora spinosa]|uniref:TetR family transcriptional regulator n=1 Tax=Saccharopolyspora spinosa TaxID=60894 RepID=A0A2N3XY19_SACSN|nr:TetR/AcrR family transcriptional regulator [Saccharopolyspora spinosa]PKW15577.1 TetR family transcriptional regulator [Saccharopolyspora spinosa]